MVDLVDKTIFSIAQDKENMFTLTAAMLQKEKKDDKLIFKMISSDGHRLNIMSREVDETLDALRMNDRTFDSAKRCSGNTQIFATTKRICFFGIMKAGCFEN